VDEENVLRAILQQHSDMLAGQNAGVRQPGNQPINLSVQEGVSPGLFSQGGRVGIYQSDLLWGAMGALAQPIY
jgi:hypothetical protein